MKTQISNNTDNSSFGSWVEVLESNYTSPDTCQIPPEILVISTYPPRECGIATYSKDLIEALENKFSNTFNISVCAIESDTEQHIYPDRVKYILNTDLVTDFDHLANCINDNPSIRIVLLQHEFGLFKNNELKFIAFLATICKPLIVVFHTVLPSLASVFQIPRQPCLQTAHCRAALWQLCLRALAQL